jgi:hypothetical protein
MVVEDAVCLAFNACNSAYYQLKVRLDRMRRTAIASRSLSKSNTFLPNLNSLAVGLASSLTETDNLDMGLSKSD